MVKLFSFVLFYFLFIGSCSQSDENSDLVLARVGSQKLYFKDLPGNMVSPKVSKNKISFFVDNWVNEQVLYKSAKKDGFLNDLYLKEKRDDYYRKILISSYVKTKTRSLNKVKKEDILNYYNGNKRSFVRKEETVFARHFISEDLSIAKKIKKELSKVEKSFNIDKYLRGSDYIVKGSLPTTLDNLIFGSNDKVVGPVFLNNKNHVYEKISYYKKGSFLGIEDVYDEILQRLIKKNEMIQSSYLLDSLKQKDDVFINLKY
jgi:hypothetical protein